MELVNLLEAKALLHIDFIDDDAQIDLCIKGASAAIFNYLKSQGRSSFYDETTGLFTADIPDNVKVATIMLTGMIYESVDNDEMKNFSEHGYPPKQIQSILFQMRDPAIA